MSTLAQNTAIVDAESKKQVKPLPCPFCGDAPCISEYRIMAGNTKYAVECNNPDCWTDCGTSPCQSQGIAIDLWNTRSKGDIA